MTSREKLKKTIPVALYYQIKMIVIEKIESGEWNIGDKIPTEKEICDRLNVSRITVRKAMQELQYEGYIKIIKGKGTFVNDQKINQKLNDIKSLSEQLKTNNVDETTKLVCFDIREISQDISWKSRINNSSKIIYIERIRILKGVIYAVEKTYIPYDLCPILNAELIEKNGLCNSLKALGIKIDSLTESLEVIKVNQESAELLQINQNDSVIKLIKETYMNDEPMEYSESLIRSDMFRFEIDVNRRVKFMENNQIILTRIDNRLVHGQVGVTWTKTIGANLIVVADDEVAKDPLQQSLMSVTAKSSGVGIRFFTLEHTAKIIAKASPKQKIFLVLRNPQSARKLVELGVKLNKLNVGNMHFSKGKTPLTKKVYIDDQDLEDLKFVANSGIEVYCQDVPGEQIEVIK